MMVLSQVRWGSNREDNNNSIKRDILRTPPHGHSHSRYLSRISKTPSPISSHDDQESGDDHSDRGRSHTPEQRHQDERPLALNLLVSLDGIHSGVPTRTTSTLTPTTLRNIEQESFTFLELTNDTSNTVPCQAGFVPPLPTFLFEPEPQDHSLGSTETNSSESWHTSPSKQDSSVDENFSELSPVKETTTSKRNMGGRRPKNSANLSPKEEEKRRVRRERKKLVAARCRKRRVDQTNDLLEKVLILENDKSKLQREIQDLQVQKEDLECLLQSHRTQCKLHMGGSVGKLVDVKSKMEFKEPVQMPLIGKIKVEVDDPTYDEIPSPTKHLISTANLLISAVTNSTVNSAISGASKPMTRPNSLAVPFAVPPSNKPISDIAGIQLSTPSNVVAFNFESLMEGGTGLTPVAMPSCSSHNKSPLDLVTPTSESTKSLVSLPDHKKIN